MSDVLSFNVGSLYFKCESTEISGVEKKMNCGNLLEGGGEQTFKASRVVYTLIIIHFSLSLYSSYKP